MADTSYPSIDTPMQQTRVAGTLLLTATLLEIFAMAHHPSVQAHDIAAAVREVVTLSSLGAWVHGVLITLLLLAAFGMSEFCLRRGLSRPWVRVGAIAYGIGVVGMVGAALVSGFIIEGIAALTSHATPTDLQINAQLFVLCRVLNQTCANFSVVATSAGVLCWSIDLLLNPNIQSRPQQQSDPRQPDLQPSRGAVTRRGLGVLGLCTSVGPAVALIAGLLRLDVHGAMEVVIIQAVWNIAIGVALLRAWV